MAVSFREHVPSERSPSARFALGGVFRIVQNVAYYLLDLLGGLSHGSFLAVIHSSFRSDGDGHVCTNTWTDSSSPSNCVLTNLLILLLELIWLLPILHEIVVTLLIPRNAKYDSIYAQCSIHARYRSYFT